MMIIDRAFHFIFNNIVCDLIVLMDENLKFKISFFTIRLRFHFFYKDI